MRKRVAAAATAIGAVGLALALSPARAAERWDMPMAYPDGNFHTQTGKAFAGCVKDASGGELEITVHGNGSLFKGNEIKRAVQTGQAPIGERLLSAHENENPVFGYDAVPFLATSFEASDKLWRAARPVVERVLDRQNLVLLYSVPWPPQGLYAKKEIAAASDLKGVKFRAYNAATARLAELTGAVPVQIEAAELSQALATGVAESFISSGATGNDIKVWEHLDRFYDVQAWLPRNYVLANKQALEALPEASRKALADCAGKAAAAGEAEARRLAGQYLDVFRQHGMKVEPPGERLRADLAAIGETMTAEWLAKAGEDGRAIVEAYRGM
jgi:TRAP-type C4-dicarboxylate transport system substrate-binding protein